MPIPLVFCLRCHLAQTTMTLLLVAPTVRLVETLQRNGSGPLSVSYHALIQTCHSANPTMNLQSYSLPKMIFAPSCRYSRKPPTFSVFFLKKKKKKKKKKMQFCFKLIKKKKKPAVWTPRLASRPSAPKTSAQHSTMPSRSSATTPTINYQVSPKPTRCEASHSSKPLNGH